MNLTYKNIIVLGAGYGGITAVLRLSKLFKNHYNIKIHLIDKNPYHTLKTQLHEAAFRKNSVTIPIQRIISNKNIVFHCGNIDKIDLEKKEIVLEDKIIPFIYIIMALGSKSNFYNIEGLKENSLTLQSYEDAEQIYKHISRLCAKASSELDEGLRKEMLTFIIGGGGLSGVEFVTELAEHVKGCVAHFGLNKNELNIVLVEAANKILPNVSDYIRDRIEKEMDSKDVKIFNRQKHCPCFKK